jgi:hypothetical protein
MGTMKTIIKLGLVAVLSFPFMIGLKDLGQKTEWKGKVVEENGVRVIKNPREALYGEITFDLEEDLSIGNEEDKNFLFYRVRDVNIDDQGNIYVADMSNYRVQKFDRNGKYLQTIGRSGEGPGEFQLPTMVRLDNNPRRIYVFDGRKIDVFDEEGKFLMSIPFRLTKDFFIGSNKNIYISLEIESEKGMSIAFYETNSRGELIKEFGEFPDHASIYIKKGKYPGLFSNPYGYTLHISRIDNQSYIYGYSKEYELNVINKDGQLLYKITKDAPRHEFSQKERSQLGTDSKYELFFYKILADSEARIYVQTNKTWNEEESVVKKIDIFSKNGYFLYKTTLPRNTYVIKEGFLYTLILNEEKGLELVKRFKIKNWDKLESGI